MKSNWLKRVFLLTLCVLMVMSSVTVASAASVKISRQPADVTVAEGGEAVYSTSLGNWKAISWHLLSPNGFQDILATKAGEAFPGLAVEGKNSPKLTLKNVTAAMNGWRVYARVTGTDGSSKKTKEAYLWIEGMDHVDAAEIQAEEEAAAEQSYEESIAGRKVVTAVNCKLSASGYNSDSSIDFTGAGSVNVKISASFTPAYWVINGAKYEFKGSPKTISITGLKRSIRIEAVKKGKKATTLDSAEKIQSMRTGEELTVSVGGNANLCFIKKNGGGAGGWFTKFDFTNDFTNKATKKTENGGRITVRVKPVTREGKGISVYTFMGARWSFNKAVGYITITNLHESLKFDVEYYDLPLCTVTCVGCTFSGGNYTTPVTSGTVYQGTTIHCFANFTSIGDWTGLYNVSDVKGTKMLTFTVHKSGTIKFTPKITKLP